MRSRFVTASSLLLCGVVAHATERPIDAYGLDEIVVTASRRAEDSFELPYSVNVQDTQELIDVRQVRTVPDAMRELPGVMVQKTGHGQGSPFIRGFTGLRTLFLIDGIRLNNSTFREGPNQYWNTVDPLGVQRLELVKGPSSVLYGSDAVGGTVRAVSRRFSDLEGDASRGRVVLRGSMAEESFVVRPELGLSAGGWTVLAGASLKTFGDLEAGGGTGTQPQTGYEERDADIMLTYDIAPGRQLTAALQYVDQDDAWRVHKTVYAKSWNGTTTGNELRRSLDQARTLGYLQYRAAGLDSLAGADVTLSLSWHEQEESRHRVRSDGRTDIQGTEVGTLGIWGQLDIPVRYGAWTTGIEVYHDRVDSFRNDYNADGSFRSAGIQGPVADDATYTTADVFLQNQAMLGDRGLLVTGVRYTRADADADAVQDPVTGEQTSISDAWNNMTGSVRYSYSVDDRTVFAGISQGFRAPNLSDLTRFDSARSNEIETPVGNLEPEQFMTYELGVKFDRDRWSAQVSVFHTSIDKLIIRMPTGRVIDGDNEVTKRNSGSGNIDGIELQATADLNDNWSVFGNLTWMDGEVDSYPDSSAILVTEPLDRMMPLRAYLGTRWRPPGGRYWFEALASSAATQDELSSRDAADTDRIPPGGTPGYAVFSLRGGWRANDDTHVTVAAENVFDSDYRIHGSGLNEPGRNLVVTLQRQFR